MLEHSAIGRRRKIRREGEWEAKIIKGKLII